jgi:hypothetical protein
LMFKPQQPKGRREKQTPKGRFQPSRTSQTDSILVQPKKNPTHDNNPKRGHHHKPRSNLASIFGTLLSSQESHAHQHTTTKAGHTGATVQTYPPSGRSHNRRRSWIEASLRGFGGQPEGPATSNRACAPASVVSVPPSRADLQNFRLSPSQNTSRLVSAL